MYSTTDGGLPYGQPEREGHGRISFNLNKKYTADPPIDNLYNHRLAMNRVWAFYNNYISFKL